MEELLSELGNDSLEALKKIKEIFLGIYIKLVLMMVTSILVGIGLFFLEIIFLRAIEPQSFSSFKQVMTVVRIIFFLTTAGIVTVFYGKILDNYDSSKNHRTKIFFLYIGIFACSFLFPTLDINTGIAILILLGWIAILMTTFDFKDSKEKMKVFIIITSTYFLLGIVRSILYYMM